MRKSLLISLFGFLTLCGCQTKPETATTTTTTSQSTTQPVPGTANVNGTTQGPGTVVVVPGASVDASGNPTTMAGPGALPNNTTAPQPYVPPTTGTSRQPNSTGGVVRNSGSSVQPDTMRMHGDTTAH